MYRIKKDNEIVKHIVVSVDQNWNLIKEIKILEFASYENAKEVSNLWENAEIFYHVEELIEAA